MSETTEAPIPEAPEPATQPVEAPATPEPVQQTEAVEAPAETPQPVAEEPKKPKPADRRFAHLSAKLASEAAAREQAERRAAAAEALLQQRPTPDAETQPARPSGAPLSQAEIDAAADKRLADREFSQKLSQIDAAGRKNIGDETWASAKDIMTSLGATSNDAFLKALAETENAAQIFADLAEDTDTLIELLGKSPSAMATRIGRMDAKLSQPKTPVVSKAPPPAPRVGGTQVVPEPSVYDEKLSMSEWVKQFDKEYPHLTGRRPLR